MEPFSSSLGLPLCVGMTGAFIGIGLLLAFCRWIKAPEDRAWRADVLRADLNEKCILEARGSPSDRLFFMVSFFGGVVGMVVLTIMISRSF